VHIVKIDSNGLFIEDVIIDENEVVPGDCIEIPCPPGFYHPKWDGKNWVEGLSQTEIDAIENTVQPKTEIEILQEQNEYLQNLVSQTSADFSAFMDFFFETNPDLA